MPAPLRRPPPAGPGRPGPGRPTPAAAAVAPAGRDGRPEHRPIQLDVPANSGEGRRIVYSNSLMRIWAIDENGNLVKTHRVSGKTGVPYPGTYTVYSRSFSTFAEHNPTITWHYMVRFASHPQRRARRLPRDPDPVHRRVVPPDADREELGQALSGGCVRQADRATPSGCGTGPRSAPRSS